MSIRHVLGPMFFAGLLSVVGCSSSEPTPANANNTANSSGGTATAEKDIVDTAVGAGSFNTLVAALKAAGLDATLKGAGPFTVFAPTDAAFAALPAGTVDTLLKPENREKLRAILTYHVVSGKVMAAQVVTMPTATTVQGASVTISATGGKVMVGNANVTQADIGCTNGVIHVIDKVLMPPGM